MEACTIKKALVDQRKLRMPGNLYYRTQIEFAYNTNHIEGSTITKDETASIYDTGTILTNSEKAIVIKDATETQNHFSLFNFMLDTLNESLSEDLIKKFHFILKSGTLTEEEKSWFNIGEYKKLSNYVGEINTTSPKNVSKDINKLLKWYYSLEKKSIYDLIEFHAIFEQIHPFQDGNGRVGRMILFRECLTNDIIPFYIEDRNKPFYLRGLKDYQLSNEKNRLVETCLNSQDNYESLCEYFLEGLND